MKKLNWISFGVALILLFGDGFCINRNEASSSNQRYPVDNRDSRTRIENLLNESALENQNIVPVNEASSSNQRYSAEENSQTAGTEQITECPRCGGTNWWKSSPWEKRVEQRYKCKDCGKVFFLKRSFNNGTNQRRSKANQVAHSKEGDACFYLNNILPEKEFINRKKSAEKRGHMLVAYYKYLGGTYNRKENNKFQPDKYSEVANYLGLNKKTVRRALSKLTSTEFEKIDQEAIKDKADKIVENYKSHPNKDSSNSPLIGAIIGLRDLGFSCLRIIELLGLKEDFDSKRKNQNIIPVDEASSSNRRYPVDNRNSRINEAEDNESIRKRSSFEENLSDDESLENKKKRARF